jgi:hypothetical protein
MRVTKLIREYVENAVCERMPMPAEPEGITALKAEWDELDERITQMAVAEYTAFFAAHKGECAPYYCDDDLNDTDAISRYVAKKTSASCGSHTLSFAAKKAYEIERKAIGQKRKETINDILVSLELGANRAELEEMLSKIG